MANVLLINASTFTIPLAPESVHMILTSPPYYGLRKYSDDQAIVFGGARDCKHQWGDESQIRLRGSAGKKSGLEGGAQAGREIRTRSTGQFCELCGAWRGAFGAEPLHDCLAWARNEKPCNSCYICHIRLLAAECWRVLRDDGTFWLNLGDSYNGSGGAGGDYASGGLRADQPRYSGRKVAGLKEKDLIGVPWRSALALQADGWYLRNDNIWHKPNGMPGPNTDRTVRNHEYVFHLTKQAHYYFDYYAILEPFADTRKGKDGAKPKRQRNVGGRSDGFTTISGWKNENGNPGKNRRSVWSIPTSIYKGAHYAAFPPKLAEIPIKAGTSQAGVCPKCGAPWKRVLEKNIHTTPTNERKGRQLHIGCAPQQSGYQIKPAEIQSEYWQPGCNCQAGDPIPATVLDICVGTGTTLQVARQLGRNGIGLDLSRTYLFSDARKRLELDRLEAWHAGDAIAVEWTGLPLFAPEGSGE